MGLLLLGVVALGLLAAGGVLGAVILFLALVVHASLFVLDMLRTRRLYR